MKKFTEKRSLYKIAGAIVRDDYHTGRLVSGDWLGRYRILNCENMYFC
ncbi:MAG: hypothetical protein ACK2TU_04095 [Anaerolineales bacterium]